MSLVSLYYGQQLVIVNISLNERWILQYRVYNAEFTSELKLMKETHARLQNYVRNFKAEMLSVIDVQQ